MQISVTVFELLIILNWWQSAFQNGWKCYGCQQIDQASVCGSTPTATAQIRLVGCVSARNWREECGEYNQNIL